jgi:hypothetical protein
MASSRRAGRNWEAEVVPTSTKAWEALAAARQTALDSLIFRLVSRYNLSAGEAGDLRNGLNGVSEERIVTLHQILDRGERER